MRNEEDADAREARFELQSRLLEVLRAELEASRYAVEARDRTATEVLQRLQLHEMLLAEARRERSELQAELGQAREALARAQNEIVATRAERDGLEALAKRLQSTLSWRLTAPLRRLPLRGRG